MGEYLKANIDEAVRLAAELAGLHRLAKLYNEPLLFRGNDISQTDIVPALA